jgi:hypothetical protein
MTQRVLLHPSPDLINCLGAEPDHMECVEHGDGVRQAVTDGVVEWDRGARCPAFLLVRFPGRLLE